MRRRDLLRLALVPFSFPRIRAAEAPAPVVREDDWGQANVHDIRNLLVSVQREFTRHLGEVALPGVEVYRDEKHPITLIERTAEGRVRIGLNTVDLFWSQYSYQYAHEYVHLLAGHVDPERNRWVSTINAAGWLEETLCEAGSLFTLRAMAESWKTNPPYANWSGYAPRLHEYAEQRMRDPKHQLAPGEGFVPWQRAHLDALRRKQDIREWNTIIAIRLLPLFEATPTGWRTLVYYRRSKAGANAPMRVHLEGWRDACPPELRGFVGGVAETLGEKLPE
jgi:hypothetical protein